MNIQEIDRNIQLIIDCLENLQNSNGSFDTMYSFLYSTNDNNWKHWNYNNPPAIDTAFILLPLFKLKSKKIDRLIESGVNYVLNRSIGLFFWRYSDNTELNVKMPYDIDSMASCSYLLKKKNIQIKNTKFIDLFICSNKYYSAYLFPKYFNIKIPLLKHIHLRKFNKSSTIFSKKQPLANKYDWETGITCNVLLYVGKTSKNIEVWETLKRDFTTLNFKNIYYSKYYVLYAYARLYYYEHHLDMLPSENNISDNLKRLFDELEYHNRTMDLLFFTNAVLMFDKTLNDYTELINYCLSQVRQGDFNKIRSYYTGHSLLGTKETNSYFGSKAMTCSLYLEFLNLYRKKISGSFFSS